MIDEHYSNFNQTKMLEFQTIRNVKISEIQYEQAILAEYRIPITDIRTIRISWNNSNDISKKFYMRVYIYGKSKNQFFCNYVDSILITRFDNHKEIGLMEIGLIHDMNKVENYFSELIKRLDLNKKVSIYEDMIEIEDKMRSLEI